MKSIEVRFPASQVMLDVSLTLPGSFPRQQPV